MNTRLQSIGVVLVAVCLATAIGAVGCGGSGDYIGRVPCQDICQKNLECDPDANYDECITECEQMKQLIRGRVFDAMANCLLDLPCNSEAGEACLEEAVQEAPSGAADGCIEALCRISVECAVGMMTVSECVEMMKSQTNGFYQYLNIFKDSVLDCLEDCVSDFGCEDLQNEDTIEGCMERCGVDIAADGDDAEP